MALKVFTMSSSHLLGDGLKRPGGVLWKEGEEAQLSIPMLHTPNSNALEDYIELYW